MSKNYIFGSGITGLLAREMLGQDWEVVPFGKSRFYSFMPALNDNYLKRDERIDDFVHFLGGNIGSLYVTKYSIEGQLVNYSEDVCELWLSNLFGENKPAVAHVLLSKRDVSTVYDIRLNVLYERLLQKHLPYLREQARKGDVTSVGDHTFTWNGQKVEFDKIVSTIPLNVLNKLASINLELPSRQIWYYHISTPSLDFEGANQVYVADNFVFAKCNHIAPHRYLFYCTSDLEQPGQYFSNFMERFDILDGTTISEAIPCGDRPNLLNLEKWGIFCVGDHAEWDYFADTTANILRLKKFEDYLKSDIKPSRPTW